MRILVIVDPQYDFLDENGSLYVKNDHLTEAIAEYVIFNSLNIDKVFITLDSHPINHCSFVGEGGNFPIHCVEGSLGASYDDNILNILRIYQEECIIVTKGENKNTEEFGAFGRFPLTKYLNKLTDFDDEVIVEVCGVAGDYCVKETIENLMDDVMIDDIYVLKDLIVSIDGGKTLDNFIKNTNLKVK